MPAERARVTAIVAAAAKRSGRGVKVGSGVMCEGTSEATEHALAAKEAGADAILLMPPHHWLRFGRTSDTAITYCTDVGDAAGIDIILHQYPAWTKASYSQTSSGSDDQNGYTRHVALVARLRVPERIVA